MINALESSLERYEESIGFILIWKKEIICTKFVKKICHRR